MRRAGLPRERQKGSTGEDAEDAEEDAENAEKDKNEEPLFSGRGRAVPVFQQA